MARMIEVTSSNQKMRINIDLVVRVLPNGTGGSLIVFSNGDKLTVSERPEDIK